MAPVLLLAQVSLTVDGHQPGYHLIFHGHQANYRSVFQGWLQQTGTRCPRSCSAVFLSGRGHNLWQV